MNALHRRGRITTVDIDKELSVREPTLVPVRKRVPVARNAKRPGRRHLENGPIDEAEMRPHQKNRTRFGNVLHSHNLDAVTENEGERKAERGPQKRHRGVPQVHDETECKNHRENHEAVIERHRRKDEQQSLPAHDEHEERHLDGVRHRMDTARSIGARKVLNNRTQNNERRTRTKTDDAVEHRLQPGVMHKRERKHRDGRSRSRERDKPSLDKALRRPAGRKRAQHVAHRNDEHRNRDNRRVEHVRHVLDKDEEYLRYTPDGRQPKDGKAHNRVPPRSCKIATGRTEFQGVVRSANTDEECCKSRKSTKPKINPKRKFNAHRRIRPT